MEEKFSDLGAFNFRQPTGCLHLLYITFVNVAVLMPVLQRQKARCTIKMASAPSKAA
jgi:hypothetical protein